MWEILTCLILMQDAFVNILHMKLAGSMDVEAADDIAYQRQTEFLVCACQSPSKGGGGVLLAFQVFPV